MKHLLLDLLMLFLKTFGIFLLLLMTVTTIVNVVRNMTEKIDKAIQNADCHPILVTTNNGYYFEYPCTIDKDNK